MHWGIAAMIKQVTPREAHDLRSGGEPYEYLDVRTCEEFSQGHAPGAKNVPVMGQDPNTGQMFPGPAFAPVVEGNFAKDARILVGCQAGGRSMMAAQMMESLGYAKVHNVVGGFGGQFDALGELVQEGWAMLGLPIEHGGDDNYATLRVNAEL